MGKRSYTPEQRTQALELYRTDGPTAVQHQLGIPAPTICNWARKAGVETLQPQKTAAAVQASQLKWEERRLELANRMGDTATLAEQVARSELRDGNTRSAKDAALTMAILVDKAQLLTGAATSRHENLSGSIDGELERLNAELAALEREADVSAGRS